MSPNIPDANLIEPPGIDPEIRAIHDEGSKARDMIATLQSKLVALEVELAQFTVDLPGLALTAELDKTRQQDYHKAAKRHLELSGDIERVRRAIPAAKKVFEDCQTKLRERTRAVDLARVDRLLEQRTGAMQVLSDVLSELDKAWRQVASINDKIITNWPGPLPSGEAAACGCVAWPADPDNALGVAVSLQLYRLNPASTTVSRIPPTPGSAAGTYLNRDPRRIPTLVEWLAAKTEYARAYAASPPVAHTSQFDNDEPGTPRAQYKEMLATNISTAQAVTENDPHQRESALDRLAAGEPVTAEELQTEHDTLVAEHARANLEAASEQLEETAKTLSVAEAQCRVTAEANERGSTRGRIIGRVS
jgi:hypothetical protein